MIEAEYKGYKYTIEPDGSFTYRDRIGMPYRFQTVHELHEFVERDLCPIRHTIVYTEKTEKAIEPYLKKQKWLLELMESRKGNWVPNSKGGEPNFYDSVNEEYKQLYMQQPICDVEPEQRTRQNDICDLCHRQTRSIRPLRAARIPTRENHGLEWACESCYEKEQERVKKIVEEMPNET